MPRAPATRDIAFSAHYACTHCGLSFEAAEPAAVQLQQSAGNVPRMRRAGRDLRLRHRPAHSEREPQLQRGLRRIGRPVARHGALAAAHFPGRRRNDGAPRWTWIRARCSKAPGTNCLPNCRKFGCGEPARSTLRSLGGAAPTARNTAARFEGIIPQLLSRYRGSNSGMQRRQLEKYMSVVRCGACGGERLNPQARAVTLATSHTKFADGPASLVAANLRADRSTTRPTSSAV